MDAGTATRTPWCADAARSAAVDPIGSASSYDAFVLVEWPLPWPRDATEVPELAGVVALLAELAEQGRRCRLQLIVAATGTDASRTVMIYRRRVPRFSAFGCEERIVPAGEIEDACRDLLALPPPAGPPDTNVRDLLVCGHGTRDVCCGARGTALASALTLPGGVRLWRTSHTGGHRFAPTAITLPDGYCWGHLDVDTLERIVRRQGDAASLRPHYRGNAGLDDASVQALDREAFIREGWAWLANRRGEAPAEAGDDHDETGGRVVRLAVERSDGTTATYWGHVRPGPRVALPPCRESEGVATVDQPPVVTRFGEA